MRFSFLLLALVAVLVSSKDLRQQHDCPVTECDVFAGTGCQTGFVCMPINCGDVCVMETSNIDNGDEQ